MTITFTLHAADCQGKQNNVEYPQKQIIENCSDLGKVAHYDHCLATCKNFTRGNKNFIKSGCLYADCDNDHSNNSDEWLVPDGVKTALPGVAFYAVTSRNHMKTKHEGQADESSPRPRYHYYFPIKREITAPDEYKFFIALLHIAVANFDPAAMDSTRFLYGHDTPQATYYDGDLDIMEFFALHPEYAEQYTKQQEEKQKAAAEAAEAQKKSAPVSSDDSQEFIKLNIQTVLDAIPADKERMCADVADALKHEGFDFSMFDAWCRKDPKYYEVDKSNRKTGSAWALAKWNSQKGNNHGFKWLYTKAEEFDPTFKSKVQLTGEYKENHDNKVKRETAKKERAAKEKEKERTWKKSVLDYLGITYADDHLDNINIILGDDSVIGSSNPADAHPEKIVNTDTGEILYHTPDTNTAPADTPAQPAPVPAATKTTTASTGSAALVVHDAANTTGNNGKPESIMDYLTAHDVDFASVNENTETEYIYFPWFPKAHLTAIQGDSDVAKSSFMYAVGAKVTRGLDLVGVPCEDAGNVAFFTSEDTPGERKKSFVDAGGDETRLHSLDGDALSQLRLDEHGLTLIDAFIKLHDIKLLVLDPIQHFLTGDMNRANDTRPQMAKLTAIAEKHNCVIAFIQHNTKDTSRAAIHRGQGSVDIVAATRSLLQVVFDPECHDNRIVFTVKNNTAAYDDTHKAIIYHVEDAPNAFDETGKHHHFKGHAVFTELLPNYSEKEYKKALQKHQNDEENAVSESLDYENDTAVLAIRQLISSNPKGVFISYDDMIIVITKLTGYCKYVQSKSAIDGIAPRLNILRRLAIEKDNIQIDPVSNPINTKSFVLCGESYEPTQKRARGVRLTTIERNCFQTEI